MAEFCENMERKLKYDNLVAMVKTVKLACRVLNENSMYFLLRKTRCKLITKLVTTSGRRYSPPKARENSPESMTVGFDFTSNWLKEKRNYIFRFDH